MRIISGKYKGRRITAPKNLPARPTTDFAKEALFNILNNHYYFNEVTVLDLFAGIGSIGFEFASRGAQQVVSVEKHFPSVQFINKITKELGLPLVTVKNDVFSFLEKASGNYDIIFADPPYEFNNLQFNTIITSVFNRELLNDNGMLIIEHSKHTDLSTAPFFSFSKKYGGSTFSFFDKAE